MKAAPKREGIWGEVREEIGSGITQQGGIIDEVEGPLGWELRAQVPVQLPDGTGGFQVVRASIWARLGPLEQEAARAGPKAEPSPFLTNLRHLARDCFQSLQERRVAGNSK